ncbi:cytochrome c [Pseudoruegeria sp. SK021]|uniref:c-type cytochrome n=1 Tax=Pseudoruegeria sp. SK021 TaxID=1933035 RepID=UPI000A23C63B|nr:cytochrome c [Pseudoruegeria sp. SK021]OSP53901.1 cytochrome C oxidase Cbb3 [Pseudoruegeria sp. SK021]
MTRLLRILAPLAVIGIVVLGTVYLIGRGSGDIPPASVDFSSLSGDDRQEMFDRGEWVAHASDCAACHTDPAGGSDLAGGLPMETPMGTIYGTNITPSKDHGIGGWSADDLYRAVAWGVAPGGKNLYPAMPYPSYHRITRADSDALWVWLMAQRPVDKPNQPNGLIFPFNVRPGVALWNAFFRPDAEPAQVGDSPAEQGEYLVNVLGHCGECHTPRNLAYALSDDHLAGEVIEGAYAPDLRADALARRGWSQDDLVSFLHRGLSPQGVMTFGMFPVLSHSTSHLPDEDLTAITAYLTAGQTLTGPQTADPVGVLSSEGAALYIGLCAGCHGTDGAGQPHSSVRLDVNTTAMFREPLNLIRVIAEGIPGRDLAHGERMQAMPAFDQMLSDQEMADLVNYLRQRWGGHEGDVTPDVVESARAKGDTRHQ